MSVASVVDHRDTVFGENGLPKRGACNRLFSWFILVKTNTVVITLNTWYGLEYSPLQHAPVVVRLLSISDEPEKKSMSWLLAHHTRLLCCHWHSGRWLGVACRHHKWHLWSVLCDELFQQLCMLLYGRAGLEPPRHVRWLLCNKHISQCWEGTGHRL